MATIKRPNLALPTLKAGDTYPAYTLPDLDPVEVYANGSAVLGQIRDQQGVLWFNWGGSVISGKIRMNAIAPEDSRRLKAGEYIAEIQITTEGVVTTELNAGKLPVLVDNCYPQITPPLIVTGEGEGSPGTGGQLMDYRAFTYIGEGPYVTPFPPDGAVVVLFFDIGLVPGPDLPMTLTADGFLLTDAAAPGDPGAPETVSLFYSHN